MRSFTVSLRPYNQLYSDSLGWVPREGGTEELKRPDFNTEVEIPLTLY